MRTPKRQLAWTGAAAVVLLLGGPQSPSSSALSAPGFQIPSAAPDPVTAPDDWFFATRAVLDDAAAVRVPHARSGDGVAAAFAFEGMTGQVLQVGLERARGGPGAPRIYVEVFRVVDVLGQPLYHRLGALRASSARLRTRLPADGAYHVLVQPDRGAGPHRVTLELKAALPFPVVGADEGSIMSPFGASRDNGQRHHEGIDISVQRLTPVLAVAAGRVMPRQDPLGGNAVWLNTPGTSYYYAHLDRIAVRDAQSVKAGDVLGYVGNTGNARNVRSHLHFGVYRWGKDPIDPEPLLVDRRFADGAPMTRTADAGGG